MKLSETERQKLLVEWNNTQIGYPSDKCVHQIFEAQAEQTPQAVALIFKDQILTYQELNRRANLLAYQLLEAGIGPNTFVAMKMDRSLEMIVAMLGILKAGGAYVPLDSAYPQERQVFMLNDTNAPVMLTQSHLLNGLPAHQAKVISLDTNWEANGLTDTANPVCNTNSGDLAYVMYTSGSTGRPKGVTIPHKGILRLVLGSTYTKYDAGRVFLQLAPISFDASTLEIWGALLHGACCVLYPQNGMPNPKDLADVINHNKITTLWLTASLFNTIITDAPEALMEVEELLTGGEALSVPHIQKALKMLPHTQLINGYGPTENTTFTCCYRIPRPLDKELASIPIGGPIANTQTYILNEQLQPVPIGEEGELYIGGDGLATGYLNRPKLTAERFIQHPFSQDPAARLYRTGDRVRYLPDGNIEFIGRVDDQVKLRGFRIELSEIETNLLQHESVGEAIVLLREDTPGDKRLVAYITPANNQMPDVSILRAYLAKQLPAYMLPSAFVMLNKIPLNPNGKADRKALPAPDNKRPDIAQAYVAPRTPLEHLLANSWCKVLQLDQVGIYDKFFELGGDSLRSHLFVSHIEQALGVSIPIVALYDAFTVAEFTALLERDYPQVVAQKFGRSAPSENKSLEEINKNSVNASPTRSRGSHRRKRRLEQRQQHKNLRDLKTQRKE